MVAGRLCSCFDVIPGYRLLQLFMRDGEVRWRNYSEDRRADGKESLNVNPGCDCRIGPSSDPVVLVGEKSHGGGT